VHGVPQGMGAPVVAVSLGAVSSPSHDSCRRRRPTANTLDTERMPSATSFMAWARHECPSCRNWLRRLAALVSIQATPGTPHADAWVMGGVASSRWLTGCTGSEWWRPADSGGVQGRGFRPRGAARGRRQSIPTGGCGRRPQRPWTIWGRSWGGVVHAVRYWRLLPPFGVRRGARLAYVLATLLVGPVWPSVRRHVRHPDG
jgi:hypothetical protein